MSDVDLPAAHIREQVAAAVDVVIHMARLHDGRRAALHVSVVEGCRDGEPVVREVFSFRSRRSRGGSASDGEFVATGVVPDLTGVLAERGEQLPPRLFVEGSDSPGEGQPRERLERVPIGTGGAE